MADFLGFRNWIAERRLVLLGVGAALGIAAAGASLFAGAERARDSLGSHIAARVEDRVITKEEYQNQLERLATDKRNPLTEEDKLYTLDRLIEEELLILRGLEIGLTQSSPKVRKAIASTMIFQIVNETAALQPSRGELRDFYEENKDYFTIPGRLRVWRMRFALAQNGSAAEARAREAHAELVVGKPFSEVMEKLADATVLRVPDVLLPPVKLAEYLGPTLTRKAMEMSPGNFTEPVSAAGALHILYLADSEPVAAPPFEDLEPQVETEFRRRAGDDALREYLDWLRGRAEVLLRPEYQR